MLIIEKLRKNLTARGYATSYFPSALAAVDYLDSELDRTVIAFGGSMTLREIGLYERLASHNTVYWKWEGSAPGEDRNAKVYISSLNGVAVTGELINIDGIGNRISSTLFGPEKLYFVIGVNKIAADYESALWRARNIAAPKNAQRLNLNTPCAKTADRCHDCDSPDRICRAMTVFWRRPTGIGETEIVIIDDELGY